MDKLIDIKTRLKERSGEIEERVKLYDGKEIHFGFVYDQKVTEKYAIFNTDFMQIAKILPDKCIDFSHYSPPFPELYQYSNDPQDMSNCVSYEETLQQYYYNIKEIYRAMKPGCITAVHCMELKDNQFFQKDFPGHVISLHENVGFRHTKRITVWKDPWLIARRTRVIPLKHKTLVEDSSKVAPAGPDYVLLFMKPGERDKKITNPNGLMNYAGLEPIPEELWINYKNYTGDQRKNRLSHWIFRQYMSPVWMDIDSGRLMPYEDAKDDENEKHVCPLQLDIIDRLIDLYTNKGEIILEPFMGVGSVPFCSIMKKRKCIATELKSTYYRQALNNIDHAFENAPDQLSIFDSLNN